jgi:hypothetical protein
VLRRRSLTCVSALKEAVFEKPKFEKPEESS